MIYNRWGEHFCTIVVEIIHKKLNNYGHVKI